MPFAPALLLEHLTWEAVRAQRRTLPYETPRDPNARTSHWLRRRVGPSETKTQKAASQSHWKRKKTTPGARSLRSTNGRPITRSPSSVTTSTVGS